MEEYEVDLRDYLRVMWERKWILVGSFFLAIIVSAAFSYRLPDEYEASALLHWEGQIELQDVDLNLPNINSLLELLKTIVEQPGTKFRASLLGNARSRSDFLLTELQGPLSSQELELLLQERIEGVREFLRTQLQSDIDRKLAFLTQRTESLLQRRDELLQEMKAWISRRLEDLAQQETALLAQLKEIRGSAAENGDSLSQEVLMASELAAQLQALSMERIRLQGEWDSPYPRPGSGFDAQLAELDTNLQRLRISQEAYRSAASWLVEGRLEPLRIVRPPQGTANPIGPPRLLNVTIAGVLGLFVGILLAFFVHYLQSGPIRSEPHPQPTQTQRDTA